MLEGDIVQMGAYIGAGLACTGMGGAAVGVRPVGARAVCGRRGRSAQRWLGAPQPRAVSQRVGGEPRVCPPSAGLAQPHQQLGKDGGA